MTITTDKAEPVFTPCSVTIKFESSIELFRFQQIVQIAQRGLRGSHFFTECDKYCQELNQNLCELDCGDKKAVIEELSK